MEGLVGRDIFDSRGPEFQAVIIVDYDSGKMYPLTETLPNVPPKDTVKDDVDREYVGFGDDGRLLMKIPVLDIEEDRVDISKFLLNRASTFTMRDDLMDMGVYLFAPWIADVVVSNPHISSLKSDLLPFLLDRQFQPLSYLREKLPSLMKRNRPLSTIEPWLTATARPFSLSEGAEAQAEEAATFTRSISASVLSANTNSVDTTSQDGTEQEDGDHVRCHGLVYDPSLLDTAAVGSIILTNIINIPSYLALNKEIPLMQYSSRTPWPRVANYSKKESSVIGENVDLTDKTITFKQTSFGTNCRIGTKTKLNNCIIMDNVVIGDNCTIQNSVIAERAVIENSCNINECVVGAGCKVNANSRIKGEQVSQSYF
eukprot:gene529-357_t